MDTVKIGGKGVKMIAHRGLSGIETENTCAAFVAAGNRSYFGIETDVHVTKDGYFVVIHDDSTQRVSNVNREIEKSTLEELKAIILKDLKYDSNAPRYDLRIPTVYDYISICKRYEKMAVLEIKNRFSSSDIKNLTEKIKNYDYLDKTIFISFSWDNLCDIKERLPNQKVQFLTTKCDDELIEKLNKNKFDLDISYKSVTDELVAKLHSKGIKINCWTCDNLDDASLLILKGVDYITSNILE